MRMNEDSEDSEDDGFITVVGRTKAPQVPINQRCADCHQPIAPDGSGYLSWCPFDGYEAFPRLRARHPHTNIGE